MRSILPIFMTLLGASLSACDGQTGDTASLLLVDTASPVTGEWVAASGETATIFGNESELHDLHLTFADDHSFAMTLEFEMRDEGSFAVIASDMTGHWTMEQDVITVAETVQHIMVLEAEGAPGIFEQAEAWAENEEREANSGDRSKTFAVIELDGDAMTLRVGVDEVRLSRVNR